MIGVTMGDWSIGGAGGKGWLIGGAILHWSPVLLRVIGGMGAGGSGVVTGSDSVTRYGSAAGTVCWGSRLTGAGAGMMTGAGTG